MRAFKVNFTRKEYQNYGENIKWRYSENDIHAAREVDLLARKPFSATRELTLDRTESASLP